MENDYKFVSKFVEGKTYNELTNEEIEKLKSGVGVKKEDKEYIDSLEKTELEQNIPANNDIETETKKEEINTETKTEIVEENNESTIQEPVSKSKNGVTVIKAIGNILKLEDGKTIKLSKEELKEKPFWHKGDVYYG